MGCGQSGLLLQLLRFGGVWVMQHQHTGSTATAAAVCQLLRQPHWTLTQALSVIRPPPPPHLCAEGFQQLAASGVCTVGHLLGLCVGVFHTCSCSRVAVLHTCSCCFACFANTGRCHLSSAQPLRLCITNAPPGRLLSQLTRCFQTEPPHWPAAQSLLARPSSASLENSTLWAIAFGCWCGACWVLPGAHTELQGCCMWVGVGVV